MLLILGKPGGGKGTICGKLLKVSERHCRRLYGRRALNFFAHLSQNHWLDATGISSIDRSLIFLAVSLPPFLLLQDFPRFHHVSTGDLLRQHVRDQTELGRKAKSFMDAGKLVPDAVMIEVLMDDAAPYIRDGNSLLLDGFPRSLEQAKALDDVARIGHVVNLDVPTETIVERIADR